MTVVTDYTAVLNNRAWYAGPTGQAVFVTYSFSTSATLSVQQSDPGAVGSFQPLSSAEQDVVRAMLARWSAVSGVQFQEVTQRDGDMTFGFYTFSQLTSLNLNSAAVGLGFGPGSSTYVDGNGITKAASGDNPVYGNVYFDTSYHTIGSPNPDFGHVAVHEIGHTLGFKHPFDAGTTNVTLDPSVDDGDHTVMSYTGARNDYLGPFDVQAVQYIYGSPTTAARPNTWSWNNVSQTFVAYGNGAANEYVRGPGSNGATLFALGQHAAAVTANGDDTVYANGQAFSTNTGSGIDTIYTGLTYSNFPFGVQGSGAYRYIYLGTDGNINQFQEYNNVEFLRFTDGTYSTATNTFTPYAVNLTYSITPLDATKTEGNAGTTPFTFTVARTGSLTAGTVDWSVSGFGTYAANAADFVNGSLPGGTLTFTAGQANQTVTVNVAADLIPEYNEAFTVSLANVSDGANLGIPSALGTIQTDDGTPAPPTYAIAALDAAKAEGNAGSTPFTFTVSRTGDTSAAGAVNWAVTGSGTNPADAADFTGGTLPTGTVAFAAGETSKAVTVNVAGDTLKEGTQGFTVTLSGATAGGTIATATATGSIQEDDAPILSIAAASAVKPEGNAGTTAFTFTVTRSNSTAGSTAVNWAVTGSGTNAADAADFSGGVLPSGTVNFSNGASSQTVTVNVLGDLMVEPDETFTVTLTNPSNGAVLGTATATGTIQNDDTPLLSIAATTADQAEGNSGSTAFSFTVTRSGNTSGAGTVEWAVTGSGNNAANAADFTGNALPTGTVSFLAGEASKTITVNVAGDTTLEPNEGFTVTLSNATGGASIVTATATGTIRDDDSPSFAIAAANATHVEGTGSGTPFTFIVTRAGDASGAGSVDWAVSGSGANAANAADFAGNALPSGTLSFLTGETSKTVSIDVSPDSVAEPAEGFTVTLSNPSAGASIAGATAAGSILDDDTPFDFVGTPGPDAPNFSAATTAKALDLSQGGSDTATGGAGDDTFTMGAAFDATDRIAGGGGTDRVILNGDYSAGIGLGTTTLTSVERIVFAAGHSYSLTTGKTTLASNSLTVDGAALGAGDIANVNAAGSKSGGITFLGGAGADAFTASGGGGTATGGAGTDRLTGGKGSDVFVYQSAADSPLSAPGGTIDVSSTDSIAAFTAGSDKLDLSAFGFSGAAASVVTKSTTGFSAGLANASGFFGAAGVAVEQVGAKKTAATRVYVDTNHDGNLGAADLLIQVSGVASGAFNAGSIKF